MTESILPGTTPLVAIALMDIAVSIVCGQMRRKEKFNDETVKKETLMVVINTFVSYRHYVW